MRRPSTTACRWLFGILAMLVAGAGVSAAQEPRPLSTLSEAAGVEPSSQSVPLVFSNRTITVLRARVLGREPSERAAAAHRLLDDLVSQHIAGPVAITSVDEGLIVGVAGRLVIAITAADVDDPSREAVEAEAERAAEQLGLALNEALEARSFTTMARDAGWSLLALALAGGAILLIARARRRLSRAIVETAERRLSEAAGEKSLVVLRASRLLDFWRRLLALLSTVVALTIAYFTLTFILRQFPYTRPWGESMHSFLFHRMAALGLGIVYAVPSLFTVLLIVLVARFVSRLLRLFFKAIEQRRLEIRWIHPDTVQPTKRLATLLLWLFALVMAYPYLPGSGTDAFKGASVFLGLVLSLGSSGFVNQIMSSFMITYSRALHVGDYVRIGDVEGRVLHLGVLSTKIVTAQGERVTLPNATVVSNRMTNYSPQDGSGGVYLSTSIRIGYDTPWRQVRALLLLAAERTSSVRRKPAPVVRESRLLDSYVEYTLLVCPERPDQRVATMSALHANILDTFNEYGIQIMAPQYQTDPERPKIVPKERWHEPPAAPDEGAPS